jgi:lipopolysaccharide export system permease protein
VRFGILQRYVMAEVARAFSLALLTITAVFVLLTVMTRAASAGLGPYEILRLIPYMIPSSLPYTVPVSLLFAATVVYGRLASDNEVIAVKTAGLSAMVLIWPSIFVALILSLTLSHLSATMIPRSADSAKKVVYQNLEDFFYKMLKKERVFDVKTWPFFIKVEDVRDRVLIKATFKKRSEKPEQALAIPRGLDAEDPVAYDMVIQASKATIKFDFEHGKVRVYFENANIRKAASDLTEGTLRETPIEFDIPGKGQLETSKMIEEMTVDEMRAKEADYREKIMLERKRQAVAAAWYIGSGRLSLVQWGEVQAAFSKYDYWNGEINKFQTEIQMRVAMAWGSLFFVILGAPVGILFARRDFLSAFISCFMPIIVVYYPIILFGVNLGKEGIVSPYCVWAGNLVLWAAAWFWALPPVRKH